MRTPRLALLAASALLVLPLTVAGPAAAAPVVGSSTAGDPYFPHQGNGGYHVVTYDLDLMYRANPKRLSGLATIYARSFRALSRFTLDLRQNMVVTGASVNGVVARTGRSGQDLFVRPQRAIPAGAKFTVKIRYRGNVLALRDPNGSLDGTVTTSDGIVVVSEPQGAPTWYPVNDSPRDKATYRIAINAPRPLTAVSNGVFEGGPIGSAYRTWRWRQSQPISSYLATIAVGRFAIRKGRTAGGVPYFLAADPSQRGAMQRLSLTPAIVRFFSLKFGGYPFSAVGGIVENAGFLGYALETATRPVYDDTPSVSTVAHELAHQWFGDAVTLSRWRDIWLNEGFATFCQWLWDEHRGATSARQHLRNLMSVPASDTGFWNPPPANPGGPRTLFAGSVYDRGAGALQALRQRVGDAVFFRILRTWAVSHRYGNGTVEQFRAVAERVSKRQLDGFFYEWLYRTGKPRSV